MAKTVRAILGDIYDAWRAQNLDWMATYPLVDSLHSKLIVLSKTRV